MNRYLIFALGVLVVVAFVAPSLGTLTPAAPTDAPAEDRPVGAPEPAPAAPLGVEGAPQSAGQSGGLSIPRDAGGQFHVDGDVNGQPVRFLVDTGADGVALTEADAQKLGISADASAFRPILGTASGTGYGAPVRLQNIEIAGHELTNVDAVIARGLSTSLLGQSVLRRLGTVTMTRDQLVIGN
ncbi:hypothetical protein Y88_2012 [Novosphingobium nitrogenifigens DSM 19370]|uniref:Peptidase A2 domain-containing protein n=1 Tax=Novosphingobium nitrogenifigens DSM 19370 TaxID=983920 RepID=F1Z5M8_9SPHN|nr:TIGR02281 family clan AA aspartic protease [Novosphingobium nitrogenifigens]EGD60138.1 hypothetical protein Y88_2012 [Novosphingobium nitrogenifigens DSM 19370]